MISLANKENKLYRNQKFCHICKKNFSTDDKKVRDHCNFTGKYRGALHDVCYLNYKAPKEIPLYFIMVLVIIIVLILKNLQNNLKNNFSV